MRDGKFCWILDANDDAKLFLKARSGPLFDDATRMLFGRPIRRDEFYTLKVGPERLAAYYDWALPHVAPEIRGYMLRVGLRGWMSELAAMLAALFPEGSLALPLLVHSQSLNGEVARCAASGELAEAKRILQARGSLSVADQAALEDVRDFAGLQAALHRLRVQAGVDVMSAIAWDCARSGHGEAETYRQLFLTTEQNQKGRFKTPQRVLFEWLDFRIPDVDRQLHYQRAAHETTAQCFFNSEEEQKKYFRGDKHFSFQEYESRLRQLWSRRPVGTGPEVFHQLTTKILFSMLGQQLYEEVASEHSAEPMRRAIDDCISYYEQQSQLLQREGEPHLRMLRRLLQAAEGPEASPAP